MRCQVTMSSLASLSVCDQLVADAFGQIGAEERPHLVAKRELFGGEAEIHGVALP